jgi:tripartite-type tricarboxylate transporter receptor subunit TctC
MNRQRLSVVLALCAGLVGTPLLSIGQVMPLINGYPSQPIKFVSPFPPGGGNDGNTRFVTSRLPDATGQSAVVDNKGGAGGNIGAKSVADAKPDGYTVLTGQVSLMAVNPSLYGSAGFDPLKDFVPITQINAAPIALVVAADSPLKNFADLQAASKRTGAKPTFATPGNGTLSHLVGVVLEKDGGVDMTHVPYKGAAPAITDLLGRQVDLLITSTSSVASFVQNGKMRVLAVTSPRRVGVFANSPTLEELGMKNMTFDDWYGFFAPSGTPPERVAYLNDAIVRTIRTPEVTKLIADSGSVPIASTSAAFAAQVKEDIARWSRVVKLSGAKID